MFLVKFRATEKEKWSPLRMSSYLIEEYIDTNDKGYALMRARQEIEKELEEDISYYDISLIKIERIECLI